MKNIGSKVFGLFVLSLLGTLFYLTVFSDDGLGSAPDMKVQISETKTINLSKPMRPVLVNFWATSCPGCKIEMLYMAELKQRLGDRFEIVAVAMDYDNPIHIDNFIAAKNYPFIFIHDTDGQIAKDFGGIVLTPSSFLIAPNGRIVYRKIGEIDYEHIEERIKQLSPQR